MGKGPIRKALQGVRYQGSVRFAFDVNHRKKMDQSLSVNRCIAKASYAGPNAGSDAERATQNAGVHYFWCVHATPYN